MIFYFTGTGNSLYAAQKIGEKCAEKLISIAGEINTGSSLEYNLADGERIGFVYPVYSWQPPATVLSFINRMKLINYNNNYIFSISTCSGDEGYATDVLGKALSGKNLKIDSAFTLLMPNNYIIGIDVESPELIKKKLAGAERFLEEINGVIAERQRGVFKVIRGALPYMKSHLINPLFNKFAISTKKFFVTESCTKCGICAKVCNTGNIKMADKPLWGNNCVQCLACIHRCPEKASQYGKGTLKKGRYVNAAAFSKSD